MCASSYVKLPGTNFQVIHQLSLGNVPCISCFLICGATPLPHMPFLKCLYPSITALQLHKLSPPCYCDSTEITAQELHALLTLLVSSPQCSEWALQRDTQARLFPIKGMRAFSSIMLSHRYLLIHIHTLEAIPLELIATRLPFTALWALCLPIITDHFLTWLWRTFCLPYHFGIKLFLLEVKSPKLTLGIKIIIFMNHNPYNWIILVESFYEIKHFKLKIIYK